MDILTLCIIVFVIAVLFVFVKDKLMAYVWHHPKILILVLVALVLFLALKYRGII